jgi:general secretion pathway protein D
MDTIDYAGLLTILKANGLTAFELNGYVSVVSLSEARAQAVPTIVAGRQYPDDQFVSTSIIVKNANAAQLTPVLRPLMPAHSFMSADVNSNTILLVDTYANVMRIKAMVEDLDARAKPSAGGSGTPESTAKSP